jgi:Ca2+-binding RTX toxin-like protein
MSHTTTRPRRFGRLAAGLTVAAAATATTLLGAAPAYAQTNVITIFMTGSTMQIGGSNSDDIITATGSGTVRISTNRLVTTSHPDCVSFGQVAQCNGVTLIRFFGQTGNDRFDNQTSTRSSLNGGGGDDTLTGGSANDTLRGDRGTDTVTGKGGQDGCIAETEFTCEA